jgi:hypothetical protein
MYTKAEDLPRDYQIALNCTHDELESKLVWVQHVFACANATCQRCEGLVDVSGSPRLAMCGGCLELWTTTHPTTLRLPSAAAVSGVRELPAPPVTSPPDPDKDRRTLEWPASTTPR